MPDSTPLPANSSRSMRSHTRGRGYRGGLSIASPNARLHSPRHPGNFSSPHALPLPSPSVQNSQQSKQVSLSNLDRIPEGSEASRGQGTVYSSLRAGENSQNIDNFHNKQGPPHDHPPSSSHVMGDNTAPHETMPHAPGFGGDGSNGGSPVTLETDKLTPPSFPGGALWLKAFEDLKGLATHTCQELKVIGSKLDKLDKIELSTDNLAKQMSGVLQRTTAVEQRADHTSETINELQEEVRALKATVALQDDTISDLKRVKEEFSTLNAEFQKTSDEKVQEFNHLIGLQQQQVDSYHETNQRIQDAIQGNVTQYFDEKLGKWSDAYDYKSLKEQAQRNKNNLIIIGLEEDNKAPRSSAHHFISSSLGIKNVDVDEAYGLGQPPPEGSSYAQPILMHFTKRSHRNRVWRGKKIITSEDTQRKVRIQQDLPKKLREDSQTLHRVLRAATAIPDNKSAKIVDYKFILHSKEYSPASLENLPKPIRPSTLATKSSEVNLVFFTRHSVFSNHHPAPFSLKGIRYANVEHYLAYQKALRSGDDDIIQRARSATDPLEAKSILSYLKKDHRQQWGDDLDNILALGLREKFKQNPALLNILRDTQHLVLGEASRDPIWGIGMSLDDQDVLDSSK